MGVFPFSFRDCFKDVTPLRSMRDDANGHIFGAHASKSIHASLRCRRTEQIHRCTEDRS